MKKSAIRLVLLAFAVALMSQGAATAQDDAAITEPVHATDGDLVPSRTYSAPFMAVDPGNERNVVAGFVEMRSQVCGLLRSTDAGQTWTRPDALPAPASYPHCFHTSGGVTQTPLAFGSDGMLYYALAGWDVEDGGTRGNISVLLARSNDLGESWDTTIVRNTRGLEGDDIENNRPISAVAVDTSGPQDVVYVAWRAGSFPTTTPAVAVSTDGGETFSEPRDALGGFFEEPANFPEDVPDDQRVPENGGGNNPSMTVADDGTVYVLWERLLSRDVDTEAERSSFVSRSTDQGETWEYFQVAPETANLGGSIISWTPHGGPQGSLHVIYHGKQEQPQGDSDIFHQGSTDGGETWTEPVMLNDDDPALLRAQFHPNLSISPEGRIDAVWWDFRDDPGTYANDVYHTVSTDNGQTWSANQAVTDQSVDRTIGPWSNGFDMRQPVGVAAAGSFTIIGWDDTRHGEPVGQAQDIYTAALQYDPLPSTFPRVLSYLLAAVIGLVIVGVILVVAALFARRMGSPSPPPKQAPREPARTDRPRAKSKQASSKEP